MPRCIESLSSYSREFSCCCVGPGHLRFFAKSAVAYHLNPSENRKRMFYGFLSEQFHPLTALLLLLVAVVSSGLILTYYRKASTRRKKNGDPKSVVLAVDNGLAIIRLNRPRKKNAITQDMYIQIAKILRDSSEDANTKCILLAGAGDYFSSGNDLSNFSKIMHPLAIAKLSKDILQEFVSSFIQCKKPIIVAVNGPAIGIATTILGLCDIVFCSQSAYFKTPFAELGQAPEACSSFTFPRIMGDDRAHDVLWNSRKLDSKQAIEYGLVQSLHADSEATIDAATAYGYKLAAQPAGSPDLVRRIQKEGIVAELERVNLEECTILQRKWISRECFEALAMYLESRKMRIAALLLRFANVTGPLWGQPKG